MAIEALPPAFADFIVDVGSQLERRWPLAHLVAFGHAGDGNLHFNVSPAEHAERSAFLALQREINAFVHNEVAARGGSISAEHGLGVLRRDEARRYKSATELELMGAIKRALDPSGIMNPGKLLA